MTIEAHTTYSKRGEDYSPVAHLWRSQALPAKLFTFLARVFMGPLLIVFQIQNGEKRGEATSRRK
jgi:hypothetical protein